MSTSSQTDSGSSARDNAVRSLINGGYGKRQAEEILSLVCGEAREQGFQAGRRADRAEVLNEAIEAARSEYLNEDASTPEDEAYNQGVTDAIAAIGALLEAASSSGTAGDEQPETCGAVHPESTAQFSVTPCRRSPGHYGPHRDAQQKGTETYSWDPATKGAQS